LQASKPDTKVTNKTIPNPEFRGIYKGLQERASFNPPDGADCRINIHRDYYYATTGCGTLEHCEAQAIIKIVCRYFYNYTIFNVVIADHALVLVMKTST
jgi:hypothetical protein